MSFDKAKAMKEIRKSITRFSNAARDYENIGSQYPIEVAFKKSRQNLEIMVEKLIDSALADKSSEQ